MTVSPIKHTSEDSGTDVTKHDAKSREKLPEHHQSASNIGGSAFRGVDRDSRTLWSVPKAQQKSEANHHSPILGKGLCETRDHGENTSDKDGATAT